MKASIPQGTRDFGPEIVRKRQYIFQTIQQVFELYGFQPLETPAFENLDTLMGKYGEEGDKLIFKILNNGLERAEKHESAKAGLDKVMQGKTTKELTERALKYDLTIPFARYVAMNFGQLSFPFKRYQIQPVWRADRPQRGRYREFTQCDADIVGSQSLFNEKELIRIYQDVFTQLKIPVTICINNRKLLAGIAAYCSCEDQLTDVTVAIDKLDKIGIEKVKEELLQRGISEANSTKLFECLMLTGESPDQALLDEYFSQRVPDENEKAILNLLKRFNESSIGIGQQGCREMLEVLSQQSSQVKVDFTLARGLNYYTGTILEVKPVGVAIGSIGGGGRYDDLTGLFGVNNVPGVGISFGVDRIYDVMEELALFPDNLQQSLKIMIVNFGKEFEPTYISILHDLRSKGISCELYPDVSKFDKQLKYANKRNVAYVVMLGENEMKEGEATLKNFITGEQQKVPIHELAVAIK
ncbi:MAG TPA: histidine--tRNA ligase [Chitinophagaceae bacterium]|nr:histidine--tRNA ligase [Chitinophagaceae bacterium]